MMMLTYFCSKFRKHEDDPNIKGVQKEIQELHEQYRKGKVNRWISMVKSPQDLR